MKHKPIFIQLPDAQHRAIKAAAAQQGTTISQLVRQQLSAFQAPPDASQQARRKS